MLALNSPLSAEFGNSAERENVNKTSNFEPKLRGTLRTKESLSRKNANFEVFCKALIDKWLCGNKSVIQRFTKYEFARA